MAQKNNSTGTKVAVGVGVAAAAAVAAAGAYWFYGSDHAKQHRKQVKSWMLKARSEVMEAVEKLNDIDKKKYLGIVREVMGRYSDMAGVSAAELAHVTKDLKDTWAHMDSAAKKKKAKKSK